jgi:hypothetical protein
MKIKAGAALILILSCWAGVWSAQAQTVDPQQIVNQLFPPSLLSPPGGALVDKTSCFVVYDRLPNGAPRTIIAAFSDGINGKVQAIQRQADGTYQVIDEPSNLKLGGPHCTADLADLDGDGVNEVRVSFASFRVGTSDWIFKWDGSHLHNIGPTSTSKGSQRSLLCSTDFVDVLHDGTLQILSVGGDPSPEDGHLTHPNFLYHISEGSFVLSSPVVYVHTFSRDKGSPAQVNDSFDLFDGSTGPYVIRVSNGDSKGNNRASSADILINSTEVFGPSSFNQQVGTLSATLSGLNASGNKVQVELQSAPGSQLTIVVEDHSPAFASGPQ